VGASGDLTPLSYVAAALCGQRDVITTGALSAADALAQAGLNRCACARKGWRS
jgi:histidine ammonia-lyase